MYADPVTVNGTPLSAADLVARARVMQVALAEPEREALARVGAGDAAAGAGAAGGGGGRGRGVGCGPDREVVAGVEPGAPVAVAVRLAGRHVAPLDTPAGR